MKVKFNCLTREEQIDCYNLLQHKKDDVLERDLARISQLCRFDPRLAEILTEFLRDNWFRFNPKKINRDLKKYLYPSAIGPSIEQIVEMCESEEDVKAEFSVWSSLLMKGIKPEMDQLYFINIFSPFGKHRIIEALESQKSFRRWGYYSTAVMFNKQNPKKLAAPERGGS
jgi:hypothetical protein